jgi:hypothetical protein
MRHERVLGLGQRPAPVSAIPPCPSCAGCEDGGVEVLSSRILLRPADLGRSRHFYRDVLGLAIYREFSSPTDPGWSSFSA